MRKNFEDLEWWIGVFIKHAAESNTKLSAALKVMLFNVITEIRDLGDVPEKNDLWVSHVCGWLATVDEEDRKETHEIFDWVAEYYRKDERAYYRKDERVIDTEMMTRFETRSASFQSLSQSFVSTGLRAVSGVQNRLKPEHLSPLLPRLWRWVGRGKWESEVPLLFLIATEIIPEGVRKLIVEDLNQ